VLTPWQGSEPEPYYAPAIIVAAFDFLDLGLSAALTVLDPMIKALIVGSLVIVVFAIVLRIREMKRAGEPEEGEAPHINPTLSE
jgi:Mg2+/citrate symporter